MVEKIAIKIKNNKIFTATIVIVVVILIINALVNYGWMIKKEQRIMMSMMRLFEGKHDITGEFELRTSKASQGESQEEIILWIMANSLEIDGSFRLDSNSGKAGINGSIKSSDTEIMPIDFEFTIPDSDEIRKRASEKIDIGEVEKILKNAEKSRVRKNITVGKVKTPYYLDCYSFDITAEQLIKLADKGTQETWENDLKSMETAELKELQDVPVRISIYVDRDCYLRGLEFETDKNDIGIRGELVITNIE